jgi:hypothetical protein
MRRSSTSAINTIREHDRGTTRTPVRASEVAPFCAVARTGEIEIPPSQECACAPHWSQTCACAPVRVTQPGGAEPPLETSLAARSRFGTAPAEVSRARGRTAFATRRLSLRFLAVRALPQPDRLGHLLS